MFVPLVGFAPDADPTQPGVITDCDLIVPTLRGIKALPGDVNAGVATAPSAVSAVYAYKLGDGTNRIIASTEGSASAATSRLYDVTTSGWVDRSSAAGDYTATAASRWTFANYGDDLYASQKGHQLQVSSGADFTAVAGAPKALCILSVLDFIVAFNTDDDGATYGNDPNRWWCSAAGDPTSWTPDVATQATTGLLTDTPGAITAAAKVGNQLVAFKERSAYLGTYIDAPAVWGWTLIPGAGLGAFSPYSVVSVQGVGVMTIGIDNIYMFDGSRAQPLGSNRVAEFLFSDLDYQNADRIVGYHDQAKSLVYWWYPSKQLPDGSLSRYLAYNYRSDRWGFGRKITNFAFDYLAPGTTYDSLGDVTSTYDDIPNVSYDEWLATGGTYQAAKVDVNGVICTIDGTSQESYYETGYLGQDGVITNLKRVRPRFAVAPASGDQRHLYVDQLGTAEITSVASRPMVDGAFDHVFSARWHKARHTYNGNMEVLGLDVESNPESLE